MNVPLAGQARSIRNPVRKTGWLKAKAILPVAKTLDQTAYIAIATRIDIKNSTFNLIYFELI